jgi:hypothetical protein
MTDHHQVTSHQNHPGAESAEGRARQGEDLAALLERLLRGAPDKTQKDLATEASIRYPTLNAWINRTRGTSRIDPEVLRSLVAVFRGWGVEVTPKEMFEAAGRRVPGPVSEEREARLLKIYRALPEDKQRDVVKYVEAMQAVSRVL